jgi:hypothetical protein
MNEMLHRSPLLCRAVEDGYGKSCGFSWFSEGPIMYESSPRKDDALRKLLLL